MSEKKRPILVPQYMKSFKCIGSACEDSCCTGWKVSIDHETYRKYRNIRDEELTPLFWQIRYKKQDSNGKEAEYAKVKLLENGKCPFLNEEMLCRIQLKRGEECLSDVCRTYPRTVNILTDYWNVRPYVLP
jgi:lysine-N-methylase